MKPLKSVLSILLLLFAVANILAQEETEATEPEQVLTQEGYDKAAPAIVKLISDEGRRIGVGVLIGVHEENVGFVLTSYGRVAGREKVAVILRDHPDPLLGRVVERWIDFDSDLAIVGVKNFPASQSMIVLSKKKTSDSNQPFTVVGHTEVGDWMPIPITVTESDQSHVAVAGTARRGIEGAPVLDRNGNMVAMVVSEASGSSSSDNLNLAVKTSAIKPILEEWFKTVNLLQKYEEQSTGISWIWAVGGGVLGASVATAFAIAGGGDDGPNGLPRPPLPPTEP